MTTEEARLSGAITQALMSAGMGAADACESTAIALTAIRQFIEQAKNGTGPALPLPFLCPDCGRALANPGEWCCGSFREDALTLDGLCPRCGATVGVCRYSCFRPDMTVTGDDRG